MEALQDFPPIVALILGLVLLAWLVLVFLVPFMIEGIRQSTRKTYEELVEMNDKLDQLNAALSRGGFAGDYGSPPRTDAPMSGRPDRGDDRGGPPRAETRRGDTRPAPPEARRRREPTISDTPPVDDPRRDRREPVVR